VNQRLCPHQFLEFGLVRPILPLVRHRIRIHLEKSGDFFFFIEICGHSSVREFAVLEDVFFAGLAYLAFEVLPVRP
jgi:hypothetical protein